jgi:hypothetical protein
MRQKSIEKHVDYLMVALKDGASQPGALSRHGGVDGSIFAKPYQAAEFLQ